MKILASILASNYLSYQWVPDNDMQFIKGIWDPKKTRKFKPSVAVDESNVVCELKKSVKNSLRICKCPGILLSSGMDSISIAYCLPKDAVAYFVNYPEDETCETLEQVQIWSEKIGIRLVPIDVTRKDYDELVIPLMKKKKAPIHPCEVGVYLACKRASEDGIDRLFTGWGCDIEFGGMDRILSKDYRSTAEFYRQWSYCDINTILKDPLDLTMDLEVYMEDGLFNVVRFLHDNYGGMTNQSFFEYPRMFGLGDFICPWGNFSHKGQLDMSRIRSGDSKYVVRHAFRTLTGEEPPEKIPFTRPDYSVKPNSCPEYILGSAIESWDNKTKQYRWMVYQLCIMSAMVDDK